MKILAISNQKGGVGKTTTCVNLAASLAACGQRVLLVDLDPRALRARGLAADDVVTAIGAQNLTLPAGTQKIGPLEYFIKLNASPTRIEELNDLPIRSRNGAITYVRDVAHVRDGYSPQTNIVRANGQRGVLMAVYKTGSASTLDIVNRVKQAIANYSSSLPAIYEAADCRLREFELLRQLRLSSGAIQRLVHLPVDRLRQRRF